MWQPLVRHRRSIGAAAAALVVVVAVTGFVDLLGERWVSAIQASTTLLLLLATATYAYLTWRLVRATEDPPAVRLTSQRRAVEDVVRALQRDEVSLRLLSKSFPIDVSGELPASDLFAINKRVEALVSSLDDARVGLPLELQVLALDASIKTSVATLAVYMLEQATLAAREGAPTGSATDRWALARHMFNQYRRAPGADDALPEWDGLVAGTVVHDAAERIERVSTAAQRYLFGVSSP